MSRQNKENAFRYKVYRNGYLTYGVAKVYQERVLDQYHVTFTRMPTKREPIQSEEVVCTCMGFKRQKYSKVLHKHVRMVIAHINRGEEVEQSIFKLDRDNNPLLQPDEVL